MKPYTSAIYALGSASAVFMEALIEELQLTPGTRDIVAAGTYANEKGPVEVRDRITKRIRKMGMRNTSVGLVDTPSSDKVETDLADVRREIEKDKPNSLLVMVDSSLVTLASAMLRSLKGSSERLTINAICFADNGETDEDAFDTLRALTETPLRAANTGRQNRQAQDPVINTVILVHTGSPLTKTAASRDTGQNRLLARSLARAWAAQTPLLDQLNGIRRQGVRFLGVAVGSNGLSMQRPGFPGVILYPLLRHTTWCITPEEAQLSVVASVDWLLANDPPMTTFGQVDPGSAHRAPLLVNVITPLSLKKNQLVHGLVQPTLSKNHDGPRDENGTPTAQLGGYQINNLNVMRGNGVDLTRLQTFEPRKGDFYTQVCVLYPIADPKALLRPTAVLGQ